MLYVSFADDTFTFRADTPIGTGKPQLMLAFPPDDLGKAWRERHHFVTTHEEIKLAQNIALMGLERLTDPTTGIVYELVPKSAPKAQKGPAITEVEQISVVYDGFMPGLDQQIRRALEAEGFEWYASGRDVESGQRDLAFNIPGGIEETELY